MAEEILQQHVRPARKHIITIQVGKEMTARIWKPPIQELPNNAQILILQLTTRRCSQSTKSASEPEGGSSHHITGAKLSVRAISP